MSDIPINIDRVLDLAEAVCDDFASQDDLVELNSLLLTDDRCRYQYLDYCRMHVSLKMRLRARRAAQKAYRQLNTASILPVSSNSSFTTSETPSAVPCAFHSTPLHNTLGYLTSGWPIAYLVATAITALGLLVCARTYISQPEHFVQHATNLNSKSPILPPSPQTTVVGRITGMVDCVWSVGSENKLPSPACGRGVGGDGGLNKSSVLYSRVSLGDHFNISSGLLEITYDTGAKVILQGPVTYEVESAAGGYLTVGKLTAKLETKEERETKNEERVASRSSLLVPNCSFAVRTPTAIVTDLGTEFGVEVDKKGITMSHVFQGSVQVQCPSAKGRSADAVRVLHKDETVRIEKDGDNLRLIDIPSFAPSHFARDITKCSKPTTKTFDLVDVVAGGNGFSGKRNAGIDPTNGNAVHMPPSSKDYLLTDGSGYHRVSGMPFIDGVFVPNRNNGPVLVSSTGHDFLRFPSTQSWTSNYLWAGGNVPLTTPYQHKYPNITVLDGVDYNTPGHGLLAMHANKGVTFDLDAIRHANPGWKPVRFRAVGGCNEPDSAKGVKVSADFWVLVDGFERFQRQGINGLDGAVQIAVTLNDKNRFLTLVATDGGNGIASDMILFGDPRLELVYVDTASSRAASTPEAKKGE